MAPHRKKLIYILIALFAAILVPFVLWEDAMNAWVAGMLQRQGSKEWIFFLVAFLLMADLVLPVPSSIVSVSSGYLLGFAGGAAASWTGMTLGCVCGYALGRFAGRGLLCRLLSAEEIGLATQDFERRGDWMVVASRPIPMLAEASVIVAGALGRPFGRFVVVCALSNLGISLVYAAAGAFSAGLNSFLLAFLAAIAIPAAYGKLRPGK